MNKGNAFNNSIANVENIDKKSSSKRAANGSLFSFFEKIRENFRLEGNFGAKRGIGEKIKSINSKSFCHAFYKKRAGVGGAHGRHEVPTQKKKGIGKYGEAGHFPCQTFRTI